MRWPRTYVPLALPRSSMKSWLPTRTSSACLLDTCGCETTMSLSGVRPMRFWLMPPLKSSWPMTVRFLATAPAAAPPPGPPA